LISKDTLAVGTRNAHWFASERLMPLVHGFNPYGLRTNDAERKQARKDKAAKKAKVEEVEEEPAPLVLRFKIPKRDLDESSSEAGPSKRRKST
jgi:hypothetical protein